MGLGLINPVPVDTGTIHIHRSPIDTETNHIHGSPVDVETIWKFKNVYKNTFERLDPQITT